MIKIKRNKTDEYLLIINGESVKTYQKTEMTHPHDWSDDALDAGATVDGLINYTYIDNRDS